ncbi:MAG: DinB family protein [Dehalococcoidia bacterium]
MTPENARLLADYNRWMNERLYDAAAKLDAAELAADKGAFFGSILATLNHIVVADTIWLQRFALHPIRFAALEEIATEPPPASLRGLLAPDLAGLRALRQRLDELTLQWAAELQPQHLSAVLSYRNMAGVASSKRFGALVQHFFNHQTHHRGQVSTLLFQSGVDVGVTDLLAVIPDVDS